MDFRFVFIILIVVMIATVVLGTVIPIYKKHYRTTNGVLNYDHMLRKFVYKVSLTREEIINKLKTKNGADELSCTFDFERSVIRFSDFNSHIDYYFSVEECAGGFLLKLEQTSFFTMRSYVPFKLNPFLIRKLQAEMIPFSDHSF